MCKTTRKMYDLRRIKSIEIDAKDLGRKVDGKVDINYMRDEFSKSSLKVSRHSLPNGNVALYI